MKPKQLYALSPYKCPGCDLPLNQQIEGSGQFTLWCGRGFLTCVPDSSGDGATAATEAEAYSKLCQAVDAEMAVLEEG